MTAEAVTPTSNQTMQPAPVFDPAYSTLHEYNADGKTLKGTTIRAANPICLTEDPNAPYGGVVLYGGGELSICGDIVKVCGPIKAPGCKITIACRVPEFDADSMGNKGAIVTDGVDGVDVLNAFKTAKAENGPAGTHSGLGNQAGATKANGDNGTPGAPGKEGNSGTQGGDITLVCEQLTLMCDVTLSANGGKGSDGSAGQSGGDGGDGVDGLVVNKDGASLLGWTDSTNTVPPEDAVGGDGGNGGNGGNGGKGEQGGAIAIHCMQVNRALPGSFVDVYGFVVFANGGAGGKGGDGGSGGKGGKGGNGGPCSAVPWRDENHIWRVVPSGGGKGGDGGATGWGGQGGEFGAAGSAVFRVPDDTMTNNALVLLNPGANGPFGNNGREGNPGHGGSATPQFDDFETDGGSPGKIKTGTPQPDRNPPKIPLASEWSTSPATYDDLAPYFHIDQLQMSFERIRTRYLLTDVAAEAAKMVQPLAESRSQKITETGIKTIYDTLTWLAAILAKKSDGGNLPSLPGALHTLTKSLMTKITKGQNVFGRSTDYAVLGTLEGYQKTLTKVLAELTPIEQAYQQDVTALATAQARNDFLGNVIGKQTSAGRELADAETNGKKDVKTALDRLNVLSAKCVEAREALTSKFVKFGDAIKTAAGGLSGSDLVSLLTNLSMTQEAPVQGALMGIGQLIDVSNKEINDIADDNGGSESRNKVVQQTIVMDKSITTFTGLKQAASGAISSDATDLTLLKATRDQVDQMCEDFYSSILEARKLSDSMDAYIDLAGSLNAGIEDFNSLLAELLEIQTKSDKNTAQQDAATAALATDSQPDLPAMTSFAASLYTHAREECIKVCYHASRACTLQSLDSYDVFTDMIGELVPAGQEPDTINSTTLGGALIDIAVNRLTISVEVPQKFGLQPNIPKPVDRVRVVVTEADERLLFAMLRIGKTGSFTLTPAHAGDSTAKTPFFDKANVRLSEIRCWSDGLITKSGRQHFGLTHSGIDHFVTSKNKEVVLVHDPVGVTSEYDATEKRFGDQTLPPDYQTIGPFTEWFVSLDPNYNTFNLKPDGKTHDLTGLTSITLEFSGTYQRFA